MASLLPPSFSSLQPNNVERAILALLERANDQAGARDLVDQYVPLSGIEPERFTQAVRDAMAGYLIERGVQVVGANPAQLDELLAVAYEHAATATSGRNDPIDSARQPGGGGAAAGWDFTVDTFDNVERQSVVR